MYEINIYQTPSGNRPLEKYLKKLADEHKDDELTEITAYLKNLEKYGLEMNTKFRPKAYKFLREDIYELRPSSSRVFFFLYKDGKFIILHGYEKKTRKTDPNEINKAIREKKIFLKGVKK